MSEHIYYQKDTGHYQVAKKIKGKQYSFGTYDTLTEAIHIRDYFKKENWPIEKRLMFSKNTFAISTLCIVVYIGIVIVSG